MLDRRGVGCGLALLALAGGFAWLTRHPQTPWLDRAAGWPLVGPVAASFRAAWRPPRPAPPPPAEDQSVEIVGILVPAEGSPRAGAPMASAAAPSQGEPAAQTSDARRPATSSLPAEQPIDRSAEPPRPLPARRADPRHLAAAEQLLGAALVRDRLGPYEYLGDVAPPARWRALAGALDEAFAARTGLAPMGEPAETVVALADAGRYHELERLEPRLAGLDADGHAVPGLAVVHAASTQPEVAEATLVHELVHLVARRALGPALPSWLDEGLAEDLAWTPFDEATRTFRWGAIGGAARRGALSVQLTGALAGLSQLVEELAAGRLPALSALVETDWQSFVAPADAPLRYAEALFFVRFLLDGGDAGRAAAFRTWLASVAAGGKTDRASLEAALGRPLDQLEPGFLAYLAARKATAVDPAIAALMRPGERLRP
jgi:hypothetical protein